MKTSIHFRRSKFLYRLTHWETWHYLGKYVPIMPVWFWYCLKSRSFWFFTASNPTLTFGGFEGESKREMYEKLPEGTYPTSVYISPSENINCVRKKINEAGLRYPVAVKPEVGMMGLMFRQIHSPDALKSYHDKIPVDYIIQELVTYPCEVSVFYYRFPDQEKGIITGFLKKELPQVNGDGQSTLLELILNHPVLSLRAEELKSKHQSRLNDIIPAGENYSLSYAHNLSRGGRLISLESEKDEHLLRVFDELSHYTGDLYYGRYDIKCNSIEELKQGKHFTILEYNGSGAEPNHAYGNGYNLLEAYQIFLHHWKILYQISRHNYRNGIPYWKFKEGFRFLRGAKKHFRALKELDHTTEL